MSVSDIAMAKAAKYDKLMAELKAKVECPVCLSVPSGGKMLACPRGHLVCGPCRVKMTTEGKEDCPVCRDPMGNNKSLLAMVVIENMEHECTNTGCREKLPYKEVTKHVEELCKFRLILCPGILCKELVPLSSFDEHAKGCSQIDLKTKQSRQFTLTRELYENGRMTWITQIFREKNETFALRLGMRDSSFYFDSVMLAERDKCERFVTTISILDPNSVTSFNGQFTPTPIGPAHSEESILTIHKRSLAKVFKTEGDKLILTIEFKVSEKRPIQIID